MHNGFVLNIIECRCCQHNFLCTRMIGLSVTTCADVFDLLDLMLKACWGFLDVNEQAKDKISKRVGALQQPKSVLQIFVVFLLSLSSMHVKFSNTSQLLYSRLTKINSMLEDD